MTAYLKLGATPDAGMTHGLACVLGPAALTCCCVADFFTARDALAWGIITRSAPTSELPKPQNATPRIWRAPRAPRHRGRKTRCRLSRACLMETQLANETARLTRCARGLCRRCRHSVKTRAGVRWENRINLIQISPVQISPLR